MTKDEFKGLAVTMKTLYPASPNFLSDKASMAVWYEFLAAVAYEDAKADFTEYASKNEFPPAVANLMVRHNERLEQEADDREYMVQYFNCVWDKYYHPGIEAEADVRRAFYEACRDTSIDTRKVYQKGVALRLSKAMESHFKECERTGKHDMPMVGWIRLWKGAQNAKAEQR